jgi:hypothetical protein
MRKTKDKFYSGNEDLIAYVPYATEKEEQHKHGLFKMMSLGTKKVVSVNLT